jgi:hypothetical protein
MATQAKRFDLNMEEDLLETWEKSDGVQELIANALDEQALTETGPVDIFQDDEGRWHIRDYGRGLRYQHFTQGEDEEKLANPDTVIGKFGVGLKDALAVLYRHGVEVTIHSRHNTFTVEEAAKAEFEDVETLHALVQPPEHPCLDGTSVVLDGVNEGDVALAKENFLRFSDEVLIEETAFGEVYENAGDEANIYVTGLRVATEPDFMFSYNITNTTKRIRDALNRERSNVGRSAYTPRVKKILQECKSENIAERLVSEFERFEEGTEREELGWKPIRLHAAKLLNAQKDVVFTTVGEQREKRDLVDHARQDGYDVVTVPENIRDELRNVSDAEGNEMRDINVYSTEYEESFQYEWVAEEDLTEDERAVWRLRHDINDLLDDPPYVEEMRVSETMRITGGEDWKTQGTWQPLEQRIVIHRPLLQDPTNFAAILLHEVAHPKSGNAPDQTREFERALTDLLDEVAIAAID